MNSYTKRIIAVSCILVLMVFCFAACKSKDGEWVSVSTDENGSAYITKPLITDENGFVLDGGETVIIPPDQTNSKGEYFSETTAPSTTKAPEKSTTNPNTTKAPEKPGSTTTTKPTTTQITTGNFNIESKNPQDGVIPAF